MPPVPQMQILVIALYLLVPLLVAAMIFRQRDLA